MAVCQVESRAIQSCFEYQDWMSSSPPRMQKSRSKGKKWGISIQEPKDAQPAEILEGKLFIGNRAQATNWDLVSSLNIKYIVNASRDGSSPFPSIQYFTCPITDTEKTDLSEACRLSWDFIESAYQHSPAGAVLVHCASGISRSVALVAHYLMRKECISYDESMRRIRIKHPAAAPNAGFTLQLRLLEASFRKDPDEKNE
uniref:protein-tyrosine-phosphatase n=2 Tax=Guillardia theta TaxID=55529 RepID=A0A7S4KLK8_GUITH|mmetsp:Transcript_2649/g.8867  ORF Transcript_2649/g.8867 Transcript_2649/m.8867 type:complete len:200 (+) Transcript_2649:1129-1728(+)